MKHLAPTLTILLTAHMKPTVADTLRSIIGQTRTDFACLVLDSGQWRGRGDDDSVAMARAYCDYRHHQLVDWMFTGEPAELRREACPVAWVFNHAVRAGLIRGRYMCTMYDDDVYAPDFVERMVGYLEDNPQARACWCTEDRVTLHPDGSATLVGRIEATGPRSGAVFDCQVDGAQVMWRTDVLADIGDPWLPEDPAVGSCRHSDGVFLDKLGGVCAVYPVQTPYALVTHRFTRWSTYTPA